MTIDLLTQKNVYNKKAIKVLHSIKLHLRKKEKEKEKNRNICLVKMRRKKFGYILVKETAKGEIKVLLISARIYSKKRRH